MWRAAKAATGAYANAAELFVGLSLRRSFAEQCLAVAVRILSRREEAGIGCGSAFERPVVDGYALDHISSP